MDKTLSIPCFYGSGINGRDGMNTLVWVSDNKREITGKIMDVLSTL